MHTMRYYCMHDECFDGFLGKHAQDGAMYVGVSRVTDRTRLAPGGWFLIVD
jgi:hypothetical protein